MQSDYIPLPFLVRRTERYPLDNFGTDSDTMILGSDTEYLKYANILDLNRANK